MVRNSSTILKMQASKEVSNLKVVVNGKTHKMTKANTCEEFKAREDVYYFAKNEFTHKQLPEFADDELYKGFLLIKIGNSDIREEELDIRISTCTLDKSLRPPYLFTVKHNTLTSSSLTLQWEPIENAKYEIEKDGEIYTDITGDKYTFDGLMPGTEHSFKIRTITDKHMSKWSYTIWAETKKDGPLCIVRGITASCSVPSHVSYDLENLIDEDLYGLWHTDFSDYTEYRTNIEDGEEFILNFDLQNVYEIHKIEYVPRNDGCGNGDFLQIKYRVSSDGKEWSEFSDILKWPLNDATKIIQMNGTVMRYMELHILDGHNGYASGKKMRFYALED